MCKPGQKLVPGDHICDIETDKATIAWEAQEEGVVARMLVISFLKQRPHLQTCTTSEIDIRGARHRSRRAPRRSPSERLFLCSATTRPTLPL